MISVILSKSFHCKACDSILKTYNLMRKHLCLVKHKNNVIKRYPDTLLYKKINNGIEFYTGRLNLNKIYIYIIPIPKVTNEKSKNKNKNKIKKKKLIPILCKDKYEEYFDLDIDNMIKLIDNFIEYLKYYKVDPDQWFNYSYYMKYRENDEEIMEAYIEVRDLVYDDDFIEYVQSDKKN